MTPAVAAAPVSLLARRPEGPLGRFLFWSALVHAVLFSLAVVWARLHEGPEIDLTQKPIKATLVRQGTPRDEKLLPRIEEAPPAPATPKPPEPVTVAPPTPAPPKPRPLEKQPDSRQKLMGAFDRMSKSKPDLTGAADGDPNGDAAVAEGEAYYARLRSQIQRFYDVSQTIPDAERIRLVAQVAIVISPSGQLERARLAKSSGNDLFDSAVLAAVKRAAPFSPPPTHLRDPLQKYGVVLMFRP